MKKHTNRSLLFRALYTAGVLVGASAGVHAQTIGPSTSFAPYLVPSGSGIGYASFTSLRAVEDGSSKGLPQMVGIPDGLGAYDNGNGTFTILMNHELGANDGLVQDHGARGAFVSQWVVDKTTLEVKSVTDLVQSVNLWNGSGYSVAPAPVAFNRLCSADLPAPSAFQFGSMGTSARIFMNGEESGAEGRAFGHVATGANAGVSYDLPALGKFSWENAVANPYGQAKTIVAGLDDSGNGQVYFYVGEKKSTGNDVERAGLTGGNLLGLKLDGITSETDSTTISAGLRFSLNDFGDVSSSSGANLESASASKTTGFQRPEDGAWNPVNPSEFFFVTTDGSAATDRSRLWKLTFDDLADLSKGGKVDLLLDGTEGQLMMDNFTISPDGKKLVIQEDPGGNARLAKIWEYDIATDGLYEIAQHDPLLFATSSSQGNFRFNRDEEASGVIPLWDILGPGYYAMDIQVHTTANATQFPGAVQHGQLLVMYTPVPELTLPGTIGVGALGLAAIALRRRRNAQNA